MIFAKATGEITARVGDKPGSGPAQLITIRDGSIEPHGRRTAVYNLGSYPIDEPKILGLEPCSCGWIVVQVFH